jgi:small nuclear ribonucleoprotein (snRNP)-like protein
MAIDSYMNLQLGNTEEYIDGELAGNLGEVNYYLSLIFSFLLIFIKYLHNF